MHHHIPYSFSNQKSPFPPAPLPVSKLEAPLCRCFVERHESHEKKSPKSRLSTNGRLTLTQIDKETRHEKIASVFGQITTPLLEQRTPSFLSLLLLLAGRRAGLTRRRRRGLNGCGCCRGGGGGLGDVVFDEDAVFRAAGGLLGGCGEGLGGGGGGRRRGGLLDAGGALAFGPPFLFGLGLVRDVVKALAQHRVGGDFVGRLEDCLAPVGSECVGLLVSRRVSPGL